MIGFLEYPIDYNCGRSIQLLYFGRPIQAINVPRRRPSWRQRIRARRALREWFRERKVRR